MTTTLYATIAAIVIISTAPRLAAQQSSHIVDTESSQHDTAVGDSTSRDGPSRHPVGTMPADSAPSDDSHEMWMRPLGSWTVAGMAQVIPTFTGDDPFGPTSAPRMWEPYLTQPVIMGDLLSPGSRFALRITLDFEGLTQRNGEITYGAWGEGFIDSRHPHTLLHELMISANVWSAPGGALSLSAGKGFVPYGTDDPMSRPVVKYPTNHHLSQILERWTLNAQYLTSFGTSIEAGIFGGAEPTGPYDLSNTDGFGDSWAVRAAQRFGSGFGSAAPWELSASFARVRGDEHDVVRSTELSNVALRYEESHDFGDVYALVEASRSRPDGADGFHSVLGELRLGLGAGARHQPYYRVESATRPEYEREDVAGNSGFFRYDHDAAPIGATHWLINTIGYGYEANGLPVSVRPYIELQHNSVRKERGPADPYSLYGAPSFWGVSAGVRFFFGGGPMRMGSYGALDPMASAMRPAASHSESSGAHDHMMHHP